MTTYFIIPQKLYEKTDWQATPYAYVGPAPIYAGPYAGSYAVNTAILESDPCFEPYRAILERQTRVTLDLCDLINPEELDN